MARPPIPSWATDPTFSAGAGVAPGVVGQPVRREPTAGQKAQGDVPGLGYVAEFHNWLLGVVGDNLAWLQSLIDVGGDFNYETPKYKRKVYPLNHGWNPINPGDWTPYNGKSIRSVVDDACWVVPLVGLPIGAQIATLNVRVKTHNGDAGIGRGPFARMEVIRYQYSALVDLSNPLTYETGPNPGWEIFTHGFPGPGPYVLDFPHISLETFAGPSQPFIIESGYEYAVRLWSGTDSIGGHHSDEFFGIAVDWVDFGPRSGG